MCWDRLLFSAKESVYEACFPPTRRPLDFEHADLTLDPRTMTFRAELLLPGPVPAGRRITAFSGRGPARDGPAAMAINSAARLTGARDAETVRHGTPGIAWHGTEACPGTGHRAARPRTQERLAREGARRARRAQQPAGG